MHSKLLLPHAIGCGFRFESLESFNGYRRLAPRPPVREGKDKRLDHDPFMGVGDGFDRWRRGGRGNWR
jgi:hypothetical protein